MFTAEEKQVYTCPVTGRKYDPLAVRRGITIHSKNQFNQILARCRSADPVEAATATEELITIGRKVLALPPIEVLDHAVYSSLTALTHYLRGKGQRVQNWPTSAPCTDCPPGSAMTTTSA